MNNKYTPALHFSWLTRFYDFLLRATFPEKRIKTALIIQCAFRENEHVLDFGTGTATLPMMIKRRYPSLTVTGIDVDKNILEIAARKIRIERELNIELINYNGFKIPFPDNLVDKVASSLVFHHLSTQHKRLALKEIYRILKPGGELHIADFGKPGNFFASLSFGIFRRFDGEQNTRINVLGLLPFMIESAGFTNVEEKEYFNTLFGTIRLIRAVKNEQFPYPSYPAV
ncbi:methyltransferase domain-containing protein [Chitinophaga sp. CC14]|uniref:class I SAM-dependent methyltransferase n=1 Tax=Chitinophaga sp. CC14 TaxID=3029199 RepID=UPI003B793108